MCKRRHESVTDWCREAFDDVESIYFLIDSFPLRVFESKIPGYPSIGTKLIWDGNQTSLTCEQKIRGGAFGPHQRCLDVFPLAGTSPRQP